MKSLVVIGAAAAVFLVFLVQNERRAQELVRVEDGAVERLLTLAKAPPGPPVVEGGYRFDRVEGGTLPGLLLAIPDGAGITVFAAAPDGAVYAYEIFDDPPPDVTPLRVALTRAAESPPLPPGWRKVR